jgi:hypothetical protein
MAPRSPSGAVRPGLGGARALRHVPWVSDVFDLI